MIHMGSNIVPLPPEASFLSEKQKHEINREVVDVYDNSIEELVAQEQKKSPHVPPDQIRREINNGMIYCMFNHVINLQSFIDPSLL